MKRAGTVLFFCGALAVLAWAAGPGSSALAEAQAALARGDYPRAIEQATQAAGEFHARNDLAGETQAVNTAGSAYLYQGEYDQALRSYQRALDLDRRQHDGKGEITRLSNIGSVYFFRGRYLEALAQYEQAWRRVQETANEDWNPNRRQLVFTNLATLYEQLGQNAKALDYYQQALALGPALTPDERGQLLSNAGTLYRRMGDAVKALESYRAAQRLYAQQHLSDAEIHVLQNIGIAQALDLHDAGAALASFTEALTLAQSTGNRRETVLAHLYRGESLYRMGRPTDDFREAYTGAHAIGATAEEWTALYGLGRLERQRGETAQALKTFRDAIGAIEAVRSGLGDSSLKTDYLADKRDVYDAAIGLELQQTPSPQGLFEMFEQARSRNLQDAIGNPGHTLRAVQDRLAAGSLLLEYWIGDGQLAVLWATRDRAGVSHAPWSSDDTRRVVQFAADLRSGNASWRAAADWLGNRVFAGVPSDAGIRQLLVVPDGVLSTIPFEVLGAPAAIERYPVSYLPSAALLLRDEPWRTPLLPWRTQLLAFGDPVVDGRSALPDDERWARLPGSARELRAIAHAVPGSATIHAAAADQKQYLLDGSLEGVPLLHFSTHAAADGNDPNRSRILFSPAQGQPGATYLFRTEVPTLALAHTDLVTLSACDTEAGKVARGEGIQSFSRAFLAAGARSTVTTLWRVADGPTADFMQSFYTLLARGYTKAAALREAKLRFLRSGNELAEPRYWAAFVLTGDGQVPIRPVLSWTWIVLAVLAVAAAIVLFRRGRR